MKYLYIIIYFLAYSHYVYTQDYAMAAVGPTHEFPYYTVFRNVHYKAW